MLSHFKYERGIRFLDGWRDIRKSGVGDCDDFAYSVARQRSKNLIHFLWLLILGNLTLGHRGLAFYWAWSSSSGIFPTHLVMRYGTDRFKWIDSTYPEDFRTSADPHTLFPIPLIFPWVMLRIIWGKIVSILT